MLAHHRTLFPRAPKDREYEHSRFQHFQFSSTMSPHSQVTQGRRWKNRHILKYVKVNRRHCSRPTREIGIKIYHFPMHCQWHFATAAHHPNHKRKWHSGSSPAVRCGRPDDDNSGRDTFARAVHSSKHSETLQNIFVQMRTLQNIPKICRTLQSFFRSSKNLFSQWYQV